MKKEENTIDLWRWKMIKKVAEYINEPDDINMSELIALIGSFREYKDIRNYISTNPQSSQTGFIKQLS